MKVGVTGTAVEDTIDTADGVRVEDLGGILYAITTLHALLPPEASLVPILGVGADAFERIAGEFARVSLAVDGVERVPAVNNKVHLEYAPDGSRMETLTGGVPPRGWEAWAPWIDRADVWLWNFISGMEATRDTFTRLTRSFDGPIHLDLHSVCLDHGHGGLRRFRRPADWEEWVAGVTWLQVNEVEAGLLWRDHPAPLSPMDERALATHVHMLGPRGLLVTQGARGASWYPADGPALSVSAYHTERAVDSTGCGDVFGAAWVALHAVRGLPPADALREATRAAGIAASIRGTRELYHHLQPLGVHDARTIRP